MLAGALYLYLTLAMILKLPFWGSKCKTNLVMAMYMKIHECIYKSHRREYVHNFDLIAW